MTAQPSSTGRPLARRVASQGALLMSGFALAQGFSFARNAIIGHLLSPADFGIAATLTMMMQLIESLTDAGADRLLVQAKDGNRPVLMANAHLLLIARGVLTALALYLAAGPIAHFFAIDAAEPAFAALALAPLIRGFLHLDYRRAQRRFDNQPNMIIEVVPQAVALLLTLPIAKATGNYWAIVWLTAAQAAVSVIVSHVVAGRRYLVAANKAALERLLAFGWPILLSALPIVAVFSGDRMVIGKLLGMEALAAYSVAFMMTMVPGMLAGKVAHALMLPLFASAHAHPHVFKHRFLVLTETSVVSAALYLALFIIAGGQILPLAFGAHYQGLGALISCLAVMWAIRMVQTVPGMALLALGNTRPLLTAGTIRAVALTGALGAALAGLGVIGVAVAGIAGEAASLIYIAWSIDQERAGLARVYLRRMVLLPAAALTCLAVTKALPAGTEIVTALAAAMVATGCMLGAAVLTLPGLKALLQSIHARALQPTGETA